jgi:hypothetical protein
MRRTNRRLIVARLQRADCMIRHIPSDARWAIKLVAFGDGKKMRAGRLFISSDRLFFVGKALNKLLKMHLSAKRCVYQLKDAFIQIKDSFIGEKMCLSVGKTHL